MNKNIKRWLVILVCLCFGIIGLSLYGMSFLAPARNKVVWRSQKAQATNDQMVAYYQKPEHSKQLMELIASHEHLSNDVNEVILHGYGVFRSYLILALLAAFVSLWLLRLVCTAREH